MFWTATIGWNMMELIVGAPSVSDMGIWIPMDSHGAIIFEGIDT